MDITVVYLGELLVTSFVCAGDILALLKSGP